MNTIFAAHRSDGGESAPIKNQPCASGQEEQKEYMCSVPRVLTMSQPASRDGISAAKRALIRRCSLLLWPAVSSLLFRCF
jgi:hypothetical protein